MSEILEHTIDNAQKITLGQVDKGTLAFAVNNAETIAIMSHGRIESYVVPKKVIDELLMGVVVAESDLERVVSGC